MNSAPRFVNIVGLFILLVAGAYCTAKIVPHRRCEVLSTLKMKEER